MISDLEDLFPHRPIKTFYDYIESILDLSKDLLTKSEHDPMFYLALLIKNPALVESTAKNAKIPVKDFFSHVGLRFLADLDNNFDAYEQFYIQNEGENNGGGFDVVIGSPPYVHLKLLGKQKDYFANKYKVYHDMADTYCYFCEKAADLLKTDGICSFIVANKFMRASYGLELRKWVAQRNIVEIVEFGDLPLFESATAYSCIITYQKSAPSSEIKVTKVEHIEYSDLREYVAERVITMSQSQLNDDEWNLV